MISFSQYLEENKKTTAQAKSMGLQHFGGGRWGKDGVTLYTTYYGTLIPFHSKSKKVELKHEPEQPKEPIKNQEQIHHPDVYEDDDVMVHTKTLDHEAFTDKGKSAAEDACLYNQVLHTIQIQTGAPSRQVMKKYNPKGKNGYGISLSDAMNGFNQVEVDGKKIHVELTHIPETIDDALNQVKAGTPVLCMVPTYGAIMKGMGNPESNGPLKLNSVRFQRSGGKLDVDKFDDEIPEKKQDQFHALMLIGVDKKEGYAIFRDSQQDHAYEGTDLEYEARKKGMNKKQQKEFDEKFGHERKKRGGFLKVPLASLRKNSKLISKFLVLKASWK